MSAAVRSVLAASNNKLDLQQFKEVWVIFLAQ